MVLPLESSANQCRLLCVDLERNGKCATMVRLVEVGVAFFLCRHGEAVDVLVQEKIKRKKLSGGLLYGSF